MDNQIKGKIIKIFDTMEISSSFKKREFVVETFENYPQKVKIELTQDNIKKLDTYNVGDNVKIHLNIRGREWESPKTKEINYFVSLNAWKIDREENPSTDFPTSSEPAQEEISDDLPF